MQANKLCKYCWGYGHTAFTCGSKPRKGLSARKPLAAIGKQGKRTAAAVAKWKRTQRPNFMGYYQCYICGKNVDYLMAEHVKSKARHPELRTDLNNLKPVCSRCNELKGSYDN